jgi:hydroxymethylbilane synthase
MTNPFRIGARGSPLSVAQTRRVQAMLARTAGLSPDEFPIHTMTTTGDRIQDRTLLEAGGKGLFTKELDDALLDGRIDLGVHSLKDLPTKLPDGIVLACVPEREDPRDALIAKTTSRLEDLPAGAVLGTASLRRQAQALHLRPDLHIVTLRGNVDTRIAKLEAGAVAATFLALAGLKRLGLESRASGVIDPEIMPPAVGQGALAITARTGDARVLGMLAKSEDQEARLAIEAERGLLEALDGSCRTPIAAYAQVRGGLLSMIGETLTPDGKHRWRETGQAAQPTRESARALGLELGARIKRDAGALLYQA